MLFLDSCVSYFLAYCEILFDSYAISSSCYCIIHIVAEVGMCAEPVEDVAEMAREELQVEACEEPVEDVAEIAREEVREVEACEEPEEDVPEIAREEELEVEAGEQPVEDVAERASGEEQLEVETITVTEAPGEEMPAAGRPDLPDAPTGAEEFQRYLVEQIFHPGDRLI